MPLKQKENKYYIDEGYYISKGVCDKTYPEHTHDFLEIVYVFSGRAMHIIDGYEYLAEAGDALFINYGSTHRFEVLEKLTYANILIKPEFISESLQGVENAFALLELDSFKEFAESVDWNDRSVHFSSVERQQVESIILLAIGEQKEDRPGKTLILRSLLNTLLTLVFRKMAIPMRKEMAIGGELLGYIRENCGLPLTMEEIAAENHYHPAYFSRLFKKRTGYNFTAYLTQCRLDAACRLLTDTDRKIGDILTEVGFSDRTKFFRAFSDHMGMTPLQYRKSKK